MVILVRTICNKMGGSNISPMVGMLAGMMPLVEMKVMEVDPESMKTLATIMAESFGRVADDDVSIADFEEWLKPLSEK